MKPEKFFIVLAFVLLTGWLPETSPARGAENAAGRNGTGVDQQTELPDIRDIKVLTVTLPSSVGFFSGLALVFLVAGAGAYYRLRKKTEKKADILTPYETAAAALETLPKTDLSSSDKIIDYYTVLSTILRNYVESICGIKATAMTTEEFFAELRDSEALLSGQWESLRDFTALADLVKFARFEPSPEEIAGSFQSVKAIIEALEKSRHPGESRGPVLL